MSDIFKFPTDCKAQDAFAVHTALLKTERDNPSLRDNAQWTMMRQDAYEQFVNLFVDNS